jgi:hypothetical protein
MAMPKRIKQTPNPATRAGRERTRRSVREGAEIVVAVIKLYLFSSLKPLVSFHLLPFGQDLARLLGHFDQGRPQHVRVRYRRLKNNPGQLDPVTRLYQQVNSGGINRL